MTKGPCSKTQYVIEISGMKLLDQEPNLCGSMHLTEPWTRFKWLKVWDLYSLFFLVSGDPFSSHL